MSSIYINIPDVFDYYLKGKIESAILTEIDLRHNELNEKLLESIYIKSSQNYLLSSTFLEFLISRLSNFFLFDDELEITLEIDINSITIKNLQEISKTKVNRLSCKTYSLFYNNFSVEKSDNRFFKNIGLIPNFYKNFSIDLIFGTPNLSNETLDKFFSKLNKNGVSHITLEEYNYRLNNISYHEKFLIKI